MSTDLTTYQPSGLAIAPEQTRFTDEQRAVLAHMGVEDAPDADLGQAHAHARMGQQHRGERFPAARAERL